MEKYNQFKTPSNILQNYHFYASLIWRLFGGFFKYSNEGKENHLLTIYLLPSPFLLFSLIALPCLSFLILKHAGMVIMYLFSCL